MLSAKTPSLIYSKFSATPRRICAALAVVLAVVIAQQSLSVSNAQESVPYLDKVVHFIAYGALGVFALPALPRMSPLWVVVGLGLFGGMIEFGQGAMGLGRMADIFDALSNVSGAFMALVLWWTITKLRA
jgi:VanZ family protein